MYKLVSKLIWQIPYDFLKFTFWHLTPQVNVFRCSFSKAIPIFFNRLKSDLFLPDRYKIFTSDWLWIEVFQNAVLSIIDITLQITSVRSKKIPYVRIQIKCKYIANLTFSTAVKKLFNKNVLIKKLKFS